MKRVLIAVLLVAVVALACGGLIYSRDMRRARVRIASGSTVVTSPFGDIEYITGGSGTPVLVIHGSGGGFDQGELLANALLDGPFRWVAPSRFGYLRSTFTEGATFDDQADAYAWLLDHLGIRRAAVVALSHGSPSALLFAVRHPERVSSLALLSAGVASSNNPDQAQASRQGDALTTIFRYDILYWSMTTLLRKRFIELMGASDSLVASMTPAQKDIVDRIIDGMHPVSARSRGVAFDNRAAMPNDRISAIRAPTLIFHATDDTLQIFRNAEFAAAHIPGARLIRFERGGHLVIAVELESIRETLRRHIVEHSR